MTPLGVVARAINPRAFELRQAGVSRERVR